ncbi:MAG: hypothetical protein U0Q16_18090 [Bryobacteraceae bacterium]
MSPAPDNSDRLREHLEKVISSPLFAQSDRLKRFLRFSLDRMIAGEADQIKEAVIGVEVFDRPEGYDTKIDPIVRVEARRLRSKLDQYYLADGKADAVRFALPKGSYALLVEANTPPPPPVVVMPPEPAPGPIRTDPGELVPVAEKMPTVVTQTVTISRVPLTLLWALLGLIVLGGALAWLYWPRTGSDSFAQMKRVTSDSGVTTMPALSPDGKQMVFASDREGSGNLSLWSQTLPEGPARRLTSDDWDAREPGISPNGKTVAFRWARNGGGIFEIPLAGGEPKLIAPGGVRPHYSPDGRWILYTVRDEKDELGRVFVAPAGGGNPIQVAPQFADAHYGIWSEDGKQILFCGTSVSGDPEREHDWWLIPFPDGQPYKLGLLPKARREGISVDRPAAWGGDSVIFAGSRGATVSLWRIGLSPRGRLDARIQRITNGTSIDAEPVIAGKSVYFASGSLTVDIWSVPLDANTGRVTGPLVPLTSNPANESYPWLSTDGHKLAFASDRNDQRQVYYRDMATGEEKVLTGFRFTKDYPILSPDGQLAAYRSIEDPKVPIWVVEIGSGSSRQLCGDCGGPTDWSPDGRYILYEPGATTAYIGRLDVSAHKEASLIAHPAMSLRGGRFSPDGKWIAFHAESGSLKRQIFIAPHTDTTSSVESWIPVTGGDSLDYNPFWSPDGNLIYFISERDGFRSIWAQRIDWKRKARAGEAFQVLAVRTASRTLLRNSRVRYTGIGPVVRQGRMAFAMDSSNFNIWTLPLP